LGKGSASRVVELCREVAASDQHISIYQQQGDMGVAGMVAFATGAIALPLIGRLLDRFGFRRIVLVCVPALALLYLAIALQPGSYWIYLVLMVWGGTFGGGTGAIAYTRPVIAAFERQRGLALGAATAGTSIAAMIVPPSLAPRSPLMVGAPDSTR
jgi:MFS family permease